MVRRVAYLGAAHALVDFVCALLMFARVGAAWPLTALVYNFCAFALQCPLGALCDRRRDPGRTAALGCAVTAAACFLPAPLAAAAAGVGNALFHVGGGVAVLRGSAKAAPLGVFVAPGAAGIYFGTMLGKSGALPVWAGAGALALCAGALFLLERGRVGTEERGTVKPVPCGDTLSPPAAGGRTASPLMLCAGCLFAVVVLRSFVGLRQSFPWRADWPLALLAALVLGKALGGLLCDKLGPLRTAAWTLLPAAALFLLSGHPAAGLGAVLLFNMTMPVTLWALARRMPGDEGFSFGLLTLALFAGYLPAQAAGAPVLTGPWLAGAALASLALMAAALGKRGRG